jgi:thioredoxin 1
MAEQRGKACQDSNETNWKQQVKIVIEVFAAPGCSKCAQKRQALSAVAEELEADRFDWHHINVLENIVRAVELGVMSPLSRAIDSERVFPALPTPERLRADLERRLVRPDASRSMGVGARADVNRNGAGVAGMD